MSARIRKTNRLIFLATLLVVLLVVLPLLLAQGGLFLRWANVSSGYGISSGDGYTIAGTGGEVDGSGLLSGDGYQVTGGFWGGVDEAPPFVTPPPPTPTPPPSAQYQIYLPSTIDQ